MLLRIMLIILHHEILMSMLMLSVPFKHTAQTTLCPSSLMLFSDCSYALSTTVPVGKLRNDWSLVSHSPRVVISLITRKVLQAYFVPSQEGFNLKKFVGVTI